LQAREPATAADPTFDISAAKPQRHCRMAGPALGYDGKENKMIAMTASAKPVLLIVDDDPLIRDSLAYFLSSDFDIVAVGSRPDAIERVRAMAQPPQAALVDLGLPPTPHRPDEGFALIGELLAHSPSLQILVLSGQNEEANARYARTLGATDFVAKPAEPGRLRDMLKAALAYRMAADVAVADIEECALVGESDALQKLRVQVRQYADSPFPVLIEGESGSGKDIVARCELHQHTARRSRPYLALNCAAISAALVEPTLFGYAKGAFTGASAAKSGYFEDAGDGTLFLDEIGELPLELQPKLLRVLENGEFQRVGETQTRRSRARVVAATNRDLRSEVRSGRFRADLYHRLSVFTVSVPALRDMGRDRLLLLEHFRRVYSAQARQNAFALSAEAERRWLAYPFPGNVRELRNVVIRLSAKYPGRDVTAEELEAELDVPAVAEAGDRLPSDNAGALIDVAMRQLQEGREFNLDQTLRRWEEAYIDAAQRLTRGNVSHAAKLLGVNRTTLYNRIEALARQRPGSSRNGSEG
jgi:DNA-binding NtrC family response regulator